MATARGAAEAGAGYCYNWMMSSRLCSDVVEEGRTASGDGGVKWLHLYMFEEKELVEKAIKSAEATGAFSAIVLTCDPSTCSSAGADDSLFYTTALSKGGSRSQLLSQSRFGGWRYNHIARALVL